MNLFHNAKAFLSGFARGWHYNFVNHYSEEVYPFRAFWYDCGYGLSYAISGWYSSYRDDYAKLSGEIMKQRMTTLRYAKQALATFDNDPPEGEFQRGYYNALKDVLKKS